MTTRLHYKINGSARARPHGNLTNLAVLICHPPSDSGKWESPDLATEAAYDFSFSPRHPARIFLAALCAAMLAGVSAPSSAADIGVVPRHPVKHVRHVKTARTHWTWRDRCAYAGYYCLYTEYGFVYHYPFDDRPIAYTHYRRRYR
jgi:hypothetical protein